ncbi:hypothetical protein ROHU_010641 [Labeo rohita]|uniref:Uncharacterized protein n=1 Tax=Labeo rohita TaxID=84645 RepID=A0A498LSL7_LABRO|nr:hypothetical protein ROHU_010641 [Labeo rohita]
MRQVWRRVRGSGETETPLTNRPTIHCGFNVQTRSRRSAGAGEISEKKEQPLTDDVETTKQETCKYYS